jgi:hypothetical protein
MVTFAMAIAGTASASFLFLWQVPTWDGVKQEEGPVTSIMEELGDLLEKKQALPDREPTSTELEAIALSEIVESASDIESSPMEKESRNGKIPDPEASNDSE